MCGRHAAGQENHRKNLIFPFDTFVQY
jgi:hypothetical protein